MTPREAIARLRELERAATPGPWAVRDGDDYWKVIQRGGHRHDTAFSDGTAGGEYSPDCSDETRDFLIAARNALPALLDVAAAAQAFLDAVSPAPVGGAKRMDVVKMADTERSLQAAFDRLAETLQAK